MVAVRRTGAARGRGAKTLLLALLIGLQGLQGRELVTRARPAARVAYTQVSPTTRGLDVVGRELRARITAQPWRIEVVDVAGHPLVDGDSTGSPTFLLAMNRGASHTTVRLRRLLRPWRVLPDGVSLRVATDDPLGRTALVDVRAIAPGVINVTARLADNRAVVGAAVEMRSGPDEHFFGLGEQFGTADARGRRVGILVQDGMPADHPHGDYAPVPFFVSTRGYGFYLAGTRPSVFDLDATSPQAWRVIADSSTLSYDVLAGPQPADVIAHYVDLTGHPPLPPPWTFGVWATLIGGQEGVLAQARRFRAAHIPVSVIWTYDAVDEQVAFGWPYPVFARIHPGRYPDLPAFTATLHRLGYKALGYISPEFTPTRPSFAYPVQHGYVVRGTGGTGGTGGHVTLLDLTNPAARRWWEGNLRYILTTLGFDGWMQDLGDRLPPGARFADGRGAADLANLYPILYAQASDDAARAVKPDAIFLMRAGFAGAQRYQTAVWAGDQRMDWNQRTGFPAVIAAGLSWGISGAPFWGSDIGGYLVGRPPLDRAAQQELYIRWLQFGALSPIMRDTLGNKGFDAIYTESSARTLGAFGRYARLHQQLFPYLSAAARTAHLTGLPIMRHLFLAYPADKQVYRLDDEYLLGPDLLVAPVTTPGARSRSVYLPAGAWVDYWTGQVLTGGRRIRAAAPLDHIPLFVRGGALLPLLARPGDTLAPATDPAVHPAGAALLLHLYPGGVRDSIVLADNTALSYTAGTRRLTLRIGGEYRRGYEVEIPADGAPSAVRLDGRALPSLPAHAPAGAPGWRYDARHATVLIRLQVARGRLDVVGVRRRQG